MKSKILVADDSATIQKIIKITLASEEFELLECAEDSQLAELVTEASPDLVLLDFNLSDAKTGYDLSKEIRDIHPAKIIMLYGTFDTIDESLNSEVGINGHIVKPFDPTKFINLCREVLQDGTGEISSAPVETQEPEIGDEWVVNQPEVDEPLGSAEEIITEQEKNQLEAGMEDWGVSVPGVIDKQDGGIDLPPVIDGEEESFLPDRMDTEPQHSAPTSEEVEEEEAVPTDNDLEYPDMDAIKAQVASEPGPSAKLVPLEELNENVSADIPEVGIDLDSTAGTNTEEELKALEDQIADEAEDTDSIWSADEEFEDPDAGRIEEEVVDEPVEEVVQEVSDEPARRKADTQTDISQPINTEVGEKTDPMMNIDILKPENLENINETVKAKVDPVVENIAREEVEKIIEKVVKEEVYKLVDKVIEKVAWEIIPDLAENLINQQLKNLADNVLTDQE